MNYLILLLVAVLGYLIGSIPSALIIGKHFFHKDIREYGSHNLGGTNAGRVLGKKAGIIVIMLDILKMVAVVLISYLICFLFDIKDTNIYVIVAGLMGAVGHCYPIYCGFRGGKAVSVIVGFLLITNPILLLIWGAIFFLTLYLKRMVSLASIVSSIVISIISFIPIWSNLMIPLISYDIYYPIGVTLASLLLVIRHIPNIKRLINHTESKIKWMDKK